MWSGLPKLAFVLTLLINGVLWSHSRYASVSNASSRAILHRARVSDVADQCRPIAFPIAEQCTLVQESCPYSDTFLSIPYVQRYFCTKPSLRPLLFTSYLFWLIFLFSTLGISASDFFCPNLGTLAKILGLDQNVAGVTFLAFGNGSPDVFSTFSAMRTNSGGLAIGELLGAAAFVISCVVGSMCIIKPFTVERGPFLRDVGFFTVAVVLLLVILWDHKITQWESMGMIALYVFYVLVVIVGSWVERRRERLRREDAMMRDEFREESVGVPYHDDPYQYSDDPTPRPSDATASLLFPSYARSRAISESGPPRLGLQVPTSNRSYSPASSRSRGGSHLTPHTPHMPSFSLIGALEFRRVVTSLQQEAAGSSLALFDSPVTPNPGGHSRYHSFSSAHGRPRSRPLTPLGHAQEHDPWDAALGLPLADRSPQTHPNPPLVTGDDEDNDEDRGEEGVSPPVITITHTPASPHSDADESDVDDVERYVRPSRFRVLGHIYHILFPTLRDFRQKSIIGKVVSVFATPAVMILTLTLPVVVTDFSSGEWNEEKRFGVALEGDGRSERLVDFEEEGVERTLVAEQEVEEELRDLKFNKWLMAVQCVLGPLWCIAVLFDRTKQEPWLLLAAGVSGLAVAILVIVFAKGGETPAARLARCTMGFIVSIVWIMAIADEVVKVLQTFGLIFGLSDAIIGLTIFAMGNSLADLVANMSVAVFAPIMGFSACFGGPLLNILLGVGISGTYILSQQQHQHALDPQQPILSSHYDSHGLPYYNMHFSAGLVTTGTGLLALLLCTLVYVPWNGYHLNRGWGVALIVAYCALMVVNVVVEVLTER